LLKRQTSKYREWRTDSSSELDLLDQGILDCLRDRPGSNVKMIWMCLVLGRFSGLKQPMLYHRIRTLEKEGYVRTEKVWYERKCYVT
jgi:DNA-binding MarR family transcriptional regulator